MRHALTRAATMVAVVLSLALLAVSAYRIDVHRIVWPFIALTALTLALLHSQPRRFKAVEGSVTLLGFVQMLAPTLARAWRALA